MEIFHIEMIGIDPRKIAPFRASPALQLRNLNEIVTVARAFFVQAGLPDRIGWFCFACGRRGADVNAVDHAAILGRTPDETRRERKA